MAMNCEHDQHAKNPGTKSSGQRMPCALCKKKTEKAEDWVEGTLESEYDKQFIGKAVPPERAMGPRGAQRSSAKFDGMTTNKATYVAFKSARAARAVQVSKLAVDALPFSGTSAYASEFSPKKVPCTRVKPSVQYEPNTGEFYGTSTYGGDFVDSKGALPARLVLQPLHIRTGKAPFEGTSVYRENYSQHKGSKREMIMPKGSLDPISTTEFQGKSVYKDSFVPNEVQEKFQMPETKPMSPTSWYDGAPTTEYGGKFANIQTPHFSPAKGRKSAVKLGNGEFDGMTTNREKYTAYASPEKERMILPRNHIATEGAHFEGQSSYKGQFVSRDTSYMRVGPSYAYVANTAPFEGVSTNKATYQDHGSQPQYRGKAQGPTGFSKETRTFEGISVYKDSYAKLPIVARTQSLMRASQPLRKGTFDGVTTYKNDFDEKDMPEPAIPMCSCSH